MNLCGFYAFGQPLKHTAEFSVQDGHNLYS